MNTDNLAANLIKLRLAARRACMCEDGDKKLIALKTKILFLLRGGIRLTPAEIMDELKLAKPNLTILGNGLYAEGLIIRESLTDRRNIVYSLTAKGEEYVSTRLERIDAALKIDKLDAKEQERLIKSIDTVIELLDVII